MDAKRKFRIVWAVDPFMNNRKLNRLAAQAIQSVTRGREIEVEPVYMLGVRYWESMVPLLIGSSPEIQSEGQKGLDRALKEIRLPGLLPLRLITSADLSMRKSTASIIEFARSSRADMIVVTTHARTGPVRWVMGSFAETLALHSDLPLLVINPRWKPGRSMKDILFPTDFSEESHEAFSHVVGLAKSLGSKIVIYHRFNFGPVPTFAYVFQSYSTYGVAHAEEAEAARGHAEVWAKEARKTGVPVQVEIDIKTNDAVDRAILREAKTRKVNLIAMASRSGPVSATLLGSSTLQVVRGADCPVWIIHPKQRKTLHATLPRAKSPGARRGRSPESEVPAQPSGQ